MSAKEPMSGSQARSTVGLATEIIAQIIAFASHEHFPDCSLDDFHCPRRTLALSHVSRQWKDITLGSSPLWASIHSDYSFDLMTACLTRSRSAPLRIRVDLPIAVDRKWFLDLLRPVARRIASLSIQRKACGKGPGIPLEDVFRTATAEPTRLETLYVDVSRQGATDTDTDIPILFSGSTPALRHLTLRGIPHTAGNVFKDLTHLHLHLRGQMRCHDLYDIIRNSPDLEILHLQGAITSVLPPQPRMTLNHLQELSITESLWNVVHPFLACLDIPATCNFTSLIANPTPQSNDHVITSTLPADLTHLRPLHGATKLLLGAPGTMALCGSNGRSTFELFSTWVVDPPLFFEHSLLALAHAFPLSAVRELWLGPHAPGASVHIEPARETWAVLFAALPRLHTLVLLPGFHLPDILDALAPPAGPVLHMLRIVCGRFHALLPWCVVRGFVRARRDAGAGLARVWVQDLCAQMGQPPGRGSWGGVLCYECEVVGARACPMRANEGFVVWNQGLKDVLAM